MPEVKRLTDQLRPYGSIAALSRPYLLFDVIDARQEEVVIFLLEEGVDGTITKQVFPSPLLYVGCVRIFDKPTQPKVNIVFVCFLF